VRKNRVWARLLVLERAVVEGVEIDDEGQVVVAAVRPRYRERDRCGVCGRRAPGFDLGEGRRRWRALDLGATIAFLEADARFCSGPSGSLQERSGVRAPTRHRFKYAPARAQDGPPSPHWSAKGLRQGRAPQLGAAEPPVDRGNANQLPFGGLDS
jgi:hypothetical protein